MSAVQRRIALVAAVSALTLSPVAPSLAQQPRQPDANAPRLLVTTFRVAGGDPRAGVAAAEALRVRTQRDVSGRELYVVPRDAMNETLKLSGFAPDTVLAMSDVSVLARQLRADEIVDGVLTPTSNGFTLSARIVLPNNINLVQPLPTIEMRSPEDAAKVLVRYLAEARLQMGDFHRCANALAAQQYDAARAAAQAAIARYPASTLGRLCLIETYAKQQQPADSIIGAALRVLAIDSTSVLALTNLVDAYREKGDTARAVVALQQLVSYQPDLRPQLLQVLGQLGQPRIALPIVRSMLHESPGDPELLRLQWLFLLADKQWQAALDAGEVMVRADSAEATPTYFARSVAAALADSQPSRALALATAGTAKYPNDASLWALTAQAQRRAGHLPDAIAAMRRALAIDPATENGWAFLVVAQVEGGALDSALASARQAVAAKADAAAIGRVLEVPLAQAAQRASQAKSREAWLGVVRLGAAVDSISSTPTTQYYLGLAAFSVGLDVLQTAGATCDDALLAESMWATAATAMPKGARAGPDQAAAAAKVMTAIGQYSDFIARTKKRVCKTR